MRRRRSLQRALPVIEGTAFWIFCANASLLGSQAAMLIVLVKLGSPKIVGQYGLGLAIVAPLMLLAKFQLRWVLVTDVCGDFPLGDYLKIRFWASAGAFLLLFCGAALSGASSETAQVVSLVALLKALEGISDLLAGILQRKGSLPKMAYCSFVRSAGAPIALGAGMWAFGGIVAALVGVVGWYAAVTVFLEVPWTRKLLTSEPSRPAQQPGGASKLKALFILTLPLGVVAALVSLNVNLLRYLVGAFLGVEQLGYYTALSQLLVLTNTCVQALGQAALPNLARHTPHDRGSLLPVLSHLLGWALALGLGGVLVAAVFGPAILSWVYRPDYAPYSGVLVWLAAGTTFAFISSVLGYAMTALRIFRAQVPLYLFASTVSLIAGLAWIPTHGLWGAAYANLAGWSAAALAGGVIFFRRTRHNAASLEVVEA